MEAARAALALLDEATSILKPAEVVPVADRTDLCTAVLDQKLPVAPSSNNDPEQCKTVPVDSTAGVQGGDESEKLTQSQLPGGRKRKVALFLAYNGAGYSVRDSFKTRVPVCLANMTFGLRKVIL